MVIKQTHQAIQKRISDILSSKYINDQSISYYKDALKHIGYDNISVSYSPTQEQGRDNRKTKL